jgi:hypothetical protein
MKYLICFLLCGLFGQAQELTKDYGSRTIPSKAVVASLYYQMGNTESGIFLSLNTKKHIIPIILGASNNTELDHTIFGAGYGKRYQHRRYYYSGQILPKILVGEINAASVEFDLGVSREFDNNLVLRADLGSGVRYIYEERLVPVTNVRFALGYRF